MPRVKKEQEITAYLKFVSECDVIDLNTVSAFLTVHVIVLILLPGGVESEAKKIIKTN